MNIDYQKIDQLYYLGHYQVDLPVTMVRMMENVLDWEHLPHVHASSFGPVEKIAAGDWGWELLIDPVDKSKTLDKTHLRLVLDAEKNYWVSTVLAGPGEGTQIHTQATALDSGINVDVRFYLPAELPDEQRATQVLNRLQATYTQLYVEDLALMEGRQEAMDRRQANARAEPLTTNIHLGSEAEVKQQLPLVVSVSGRRFCVNFIDDEWFIYSADCPHLLGPLEKAEVKNGIVSCPWHGYRFDLRSGASCDGKTLHLAEAPTLLVEKGDVVVIPAHPNSKSLPL